MSTILIRTSGRLPVSGLLTRRAVAGCTAMALGTLAVTVVALMLGEVRYSPAQVAQALFGDAGRLTELFVVTWRLPRALAAAVLGAALGMSGALFQSVTRNPLGSPDIVGFTAGASAGGIAMVAFVSSSFAAVATGALAGGLAVAAAVLLLSRGGGAAGFRLVIVGIAISAMLGSVQTWLILTTDLELAQAAAVWGVGSLNSTSWELSGVALAVAALAMVLIGILLGRQMSLFDLGEDASAALGVPPTRTRLLAVLAGVVLVAVATAVAGPIAFVALAAPHVGRRITGVSGTALTPALLAGAFLLASADVVAQHLPGLFSEDAGGYPVGVVTVALGGIYLITLLVRENRKGTL